MLVWASSSIRADLGPAVDDRLRGPSPRRPAPVLDLLSGDDRQVPDQLGGVRPPVGLDKADGHVGAPIVPPPALVEHGAGLAHPGRRAQVDPELAGRADGLDRFLVNRRLPFAHRTILAELAVAGNPGPPAAGRAGGQQERPGAGPYTRQGRRREGPVNSLRKGMPARWWRWAASPPSAPHGPIAHPPVGGHPGPGAGGAGGGRRGPGRPVGRRGGGGRRLPGLRPPLHPPLRHPVGGRGRELGGPGGLRGGHGGGGRPGVVPAAGPDRPPASTRRRPVASTPSRTCCSRTCRSTELLQRIVTTVHQAFDPAWVALLLARGRHAGGGRHRRGAADRR